MGNNNYQKQLQSMEWAQIRSCILTRDGFKCAECGEPESKSVSLQVHHLTYTGHDFSMGIFNEKPSHLITLCERCHDIVTNMGKEERQYFNNQWRQYLLSKENNLNVSSPMILPKRPHIEPVISSEKALLNKDVDFSVIRKKKPEITQGAKNIPDIYSRDH